jgi:hypothetical protein
MELLEIVFSSDEAAPNGAVSMRNTPSSDAAAIGTIPDIDRRRALRSHKQKRQSRGLA